jgi:nucleotidyltransferase substrate binding protein (TIGR01987 family)
MKDVENFKKALINLGDINKINKPYSNVERMGLVGLYGICFEQSWKAMKELLYHSGLPAAATGSPKGIIKEAYSNGMIKDEEMWLGALVDRDNLSHAYNHEVAYSIIKNIKEKYLAMFGELKLEIEKNWQD